jgi:hypothetical protein
MPRPLCTTLLGLALLAPLAPLACDDKPPALAPDAPKAAVPEPANVAPKVPIAEQPRKPLSLVAIPFTVDVPPGWKVASHDLPSRSVTMLEGPLEGDEVRISLAAREEVSGEILKQLIEKAKREAADDRSIELSVRPTGGLQAVSRRRRDAAQHTAQRGRGVAKHGGLARFALPAQRRAAPAIRDALHRPDRRHVPAQQGVARRGH